MTRRFNLRLAFAVLVVLAGAAVQLAKEHRPSVLRPGLRMCAYVASAADGTVTVVDLVHLAATATIPVGRRPWNMAITRDGAKLYVANGRSNTVSVIDTARNAVIKEIPVGETPWGVQILE